MFFNWVISVTYNSMVSSGIHVEIRIELKKKDSVNFFNEEAGVRIY